MDTVTVWICDCNHAHSHEHGCVFCKGSRRVYLKASYYVRYPVPWICRWCQGNNSAGDDKCRKHKCPGAPRVYSVCQCPKLVLNEKASLCDDCSSERVPVYRVALTRLRFYPRKWWSSPMLPCKECT